jgi:hypothetical protein
VAILVDAKRSGGNDGVVFRWVTPTELRVEYLGAATAALTRPRVAVAGYVVGVSLDSGVAHASAPTTAGPSIPQGFLERYGARAP